MVPWRKAKQRQQRGNLPKNSHHGALADLMPRPPLTFILSPRNEGRGEGEGCIGRLKTCVSKFMKWIPFLTVSPPVWRFFLCSGQILDQDFLFSGYIFV